jgi:hypothetical protein
MVERSDTHHLEPRDGDGFRKRGWASIRSAPEEVEIQVTVTVLDCTVIRALSS